ncbi:hypothetical protein [Bradyrhizobium sp. USDA 4486]
MSFRGMKSIGSWPQEAYGLMNARDAALRSMHLYAEGNPNASATQRDRVEAIMALEQLRGGLNERVTIMRQQTSGLAYEEGEQENPVDEHSNRRQQVNIKEEQWRARPEAFAGICECLAPNTST